jgi:GTP-binding protein
LEIRSVAFHRAAYKAEDFPRDGRPQFAIVGRSNVGKSSLINTIFRRRDLARVSQTPGKTQAIQFYLVNEAMYVVDLPGYGYAKVPRALVASWGDLINSYLENSSSLRVIFVLLDVRRTPTADDIQMIDWVREAGKEFRIVMTKVDKVSNNERAKAKRVIADKTGVDPADIIPFSKTTKEGVEHLWRVIDSMRKPAERPASAGAEG